jgi:hypothetical protein
VAEDRIDQIKARLSAATPGPWRWRGYLNQGIELRGGRFGDVVLAPERAGFHWTSFRVNAGGLLESIRKFAVREVPYRDDVIDVVHPDAELIANAPADIEFLLGEIDQLREDYEAAVRDMDGYLNKLGPLEAAMEAASPTARDDRGALVRAVWIAWAEEQPNPKPSWLVPYHMLSEPDKEVDRRIGDALFGLGRASRDDEVRRLDDLVERMLALVNHSERAGCPMAFHRSYGEECTCGALDVVREARAAVAAVGSAS